MTRTTRLGEWIRNSLNPRNKKRESIRAHDRTGVFKVSNILDSIAFTFTKTVDESRKRKGNEATIRFYVCEPFFVLFFCSSFEISILYLKNSRAIVISQLDLCSLRRVEKKNVTSVVDNNINYAFEFGFFLFFFKFFYYNEVFLGDNLVFLNNWYFFLFILVFDRCSTRLGAFFNTILHVEWKIMRLKLATLECNNFFFWWFVQFFKSS